MGYKSYGFPRSARLLTAPAYSRVFKQPRKLTDRFFTLLWRENEIGHCRLGLAISKKNNRRAVDRNLIKRLVRESFRDHRSELPAVDIVVLSRRGITAADRHELTVSLQRYWKRLSDQSSRHA